MNVEITSEQKKIISDKIAMCVDFLKSIVQPHIIKDDKVVVRLDENLDLVVTPEEIYVRETRIISFIIEIERYCSYNLEKSNNKKSKKYICDTNPDLAVVFLQNWEKAKNALLDEVDTKNQQIDVLDDFINNFRL